MIAPDCRRCVHRVAAPGTHHIACAHPVARVAPLQAFGLLVLSGRVEAKPVEPGLPDGFRLVANEHGISEGWCTWPLDFDPIWIRECSGFSDGNTSRSETDVVGPDAGPDATQGRDGAASGSPTGAEEGARDAVSDAG